jgi:hypothetical protein
MKERSRSTFFSAFAIFLSFILGSCTGSSETQAPEGGLALPSAEIVAPTLDATARPTEAASLEITPAPAPEEVLAACPPGGQAEAMRPGSETDWEWLNLSTCYDLEFVLSSGPPGYSGTARVTYLNLEAGEVPDLVFRLYPNASRIYGGELQITAVRVDGAPAEHEIFLEDRSAFRIPLDRPLLPGEALLVELEFTGQVPVDLEGQTGVYGIFNFDSNQEVLTLANGYPILAIREEGDWIAEPVVGIGDAVVSQAALYRVQVAAPDGWQVIGTGTAREGSTSEGNSAPNSSPARCENSPWSPVRISSRSRKKLTVCRSAIGDYRAVRIAGEIRCKPQSIPFSSSMTASAFILTRSWMSSRCRCALRPASNIQA